MTVPSEDLRLSDAFPRPERDQWRELVRGVLRKSGAATGETPLDEVESLLGGHTYDGVPLAALYTAADGVDARPGLAPGVHEIRPDGEGLAGWDVRQRHADPDPARTREAVLADLENGATSIWLVLGEGGAPVAALAELLADVRLQLAPVVLDAGAATAASADAFLGLLTERGLIGSGEPGLGNLGADPLGLAARTGAPADLSTAAELALRCARGFPGVRAITVDATVHHDAGGGDAQELGCAIASGVAYLRALTEAGLGPADALAQIDFRLAATADQFLTIAKLRAARRLWARVAEVSGARREDGGRVRLHAVTSSAMMTRRDPWVNMLRTTVACFAAGVGGADALTVQPFDARLGLPDDFARRIARNTQTLLLEESSLARVVDPAGGSWYVERLTEELARSAWAWFTEIERAGGAALALESGLIGERLAAVWAARRDDIARRRAPLTGVSRFPDPEERLPERPAVPSPPGGGLPRVSYAQDFEALRDRVDAHAETTGTRPGVFLATLGPPAAHNARADFAAGLFQAGGLATPSGEPAAFADSEAGVACLCSSDALYAEGAVEAARELKRAGAARVWLAGKDSYEDVDGILFAGCDAVEVLETTLRDLGVEAG